MKRWIRCEHPRIMSVRYYLVAGQEVSDDAFAGATRRKAVDEIDARAQFAEEFKLGRAIEPDTECRETTL